MLEENAEKPNADGPAEVTKRLTEDARGLGPMRAGPFAIGDVDEIVGEGGVEVPGFVATKNEILQLVRYWATEIIDLDWIFFVYGSTGSSEWRTREFANRRLNAIGKLIGKEEVTQAFRQAEQAFGKGVDQWAWKIFTEGSCPASSSKRLVCASHTGVSSEGTTLKILTPEPVFARSIG